MALCLASCLHRRFSGGRGGACLSLSPEALEAGVSEPGCQAGLLPVSLRVTLRESLSLSDPAVLGPALC